MSTNIVVDVALSALRQLNQAQVNANRQAKLLADRNSTLAQKAVDADAAAKAQPGQGQDPRGALLYGVKSDRKKPQEQPAVYRSDFASVKLAWCWTRRTSSTSAENPAVTSLQTGSSINIGQYYRAPEKRTYLIVSGDGSATLSVDLEMPESAAVRAAAPANYSASYSDFFTPGSTAASNFLLRSRLLPTGQDGVGILMLRHDYYFLSQVLGTPAPGDDLAEFYRAEYVGRGIGCWLVSPSAIRPLSTPAALQTASDNATTSWTIVDGTNPASVSGPYAGVPMPQQPQLSGSVVHYQPVGSVVEYHGWWTFYSRPEDSYATPLEFQRLALASQYTAPPATVWVEPDFVTTPGLFEDFWGGGSGLLEWGDAINLKNPMRWGGKVYPRTGVPVTQVQGDLPLMPNLTRDMSASASVPPRSGSPLYGFQAAHDHGMTGYCRARLLELGFTSGDLTP